MVRFAVITAYLALIVHGRRKFSHAEESKGSRYAGSQRSSEQLQSLLFALHPSAPGRSGVATHRRVPVRTADASMQSPMGESAGQTSAKEEALTASLAGLIAASMALAPSSAFAEGGAKLTEEALKVANGEELSWFETYVKFIQDGIFLVHDGLGGIGFPYPYAAAIFFLVLLAKSITFPLNYQQYEGNAAMKATAPQRDLIQKWYADDQMQMNIQLGSLFDEININPLASILPTFFQIPILLGVYYACTAIAKAEVYTEGFLWIPSLIGPISDRTEGITWLTDGRFGLEDTIAYLSLPAILVITQFASLKALGSFDAMKDAEKNGGGGAVGKILYVIPFFLGWVAMSAPAALGLYWLFSNVFTTIVTTTVKKLTQMDAFIADVDMATIGPRRDPLPLVVKDWSDQLQPEEAAEEAAVDVEVVDESSAEVAAGS
jgi:YidC/Oxa1 family membrane protein insertase